MGAHVYIVGIGVTALIIFTGLLCTSPSEHTTSAFFMQAACRGVSCTEIHTAFPSVHRFCSATRMSSGINIYNISLNTFLLKWRTGVSHVPQMLLFLHLEYDTVMRIQSSSAKYHYQTIMYHNIIFLTEQNYCLQKNVTNPFVPKIGYFHNCCVNRCRNT